MADTTPLRVRPTLAAVAKRVIAAGVLAETRRAPDRADALIAVGAWLSEHIQVPHLPPDQTFLDELADQVDEVAPDWPDEDPYAEPPIGRRRRVR